MNNVWIVEDDYLQRDTICKKIEEKYKVNIDSIINECEFREKIKNLKTPYPDLIILDIMLPWTKASEKIEEPPIEVKEEGFHRAGIRCEKLVRQKHEIRDIPIIIYTMLNRSDIQDDLKKLSKCSTYLGKSGDIDDLVSLVNTHID